MSYILDALRKAEAERHPGNAAPLPGIPAYPAPANAPATADRRPWLWAAASLAGGALAAFAWLAWQAPQATPPASSPLLDGRPASSAPAAASPPSASAPAASPPPRAQASEPRAQPRDEEKPARAKARDTTKPASPRHGKVAEPRHRTADKAPAKADSKLASKAASVPAAGTDTGSAVPALSELPASVRQQIPALSVNGYLYSPNPADRSALINNRLVREGEQIAPGLMLEQLQPKGMVLNFQGHRYRSAY